MRLRMLKHCVGKGRQVIKQLCRGVLHYYATMATERAGYVLYRALVIILFHTHASLILPPCTHSLMQITDPLPPLVSASLQPGVYFIRDNIIKVTPGSALMLAEVAVATGITSNWLITDDTGMRMETVSGGTIVMEFYCWQNWQAQICLI